MRATDIPQLSQLTTPEKILLLEDLWEEISADESNVALPDSHKEELNVRFEAYRTNPGNLLSLSELQERIDQRK